MAPDCIYNITGLANNIVQGFFVTNFITFTFLLLCLVPFWVQLVTSCDKLHKLHFSMFFTSVFTKIHCAFKTVIGLYRVAGQCRQLYTPMQKSTRNKQKLNQRPPQTTLPTDEYTMGFQIRPTLVINEYSPLLAPLTTDQIYTNNSLPTTKTCRRQSYRQQNPYLASNTAIGHYT